MGLRAKLLLPFLVVLLVSGIISHFLIVHYLVQKEISSTLEKERTFLQMLGKSIQNDVISQDLANLHSTLAQMTFNAGWTSIEVRNKSGIRLYPLATEPKETGHKIQVTLEQSGIENGKLLAHYQRDNLVEIIEKKYLVVEVFFLGLFGIGIICAVSIHHRQAVLPIEELSKASVKLARGEYDAELPVARTDEIGCLISAYNQMMNDLHHREETLKMETAEKEILLTQLQASLTKSEAKLQSRKSQWGMVGQIVNNSPVATFVIDKDHKVTHWNRAAEKLSKYSIFKILGTTDAWKPFYTEKRPTMADLIVDECTDTLENYYSEKHLQGSNETNIWHAEDFFSDFADGGKWIKFSAAPILDEAGNIIGAIETLRDITEERKLQAELEDRVEQRTEELNKSKKALQETVDKLKLTQDELVEAEKMSSLASLVGGVAHEVNTPLGVCITAATHQAECNEKITEKVANQSLKKSDLDNFLLQCSDTSTILDMNLSRAAKLIRSFKKVAVDQSSEEERIINLKEYISETMMSLHPKLKKTDININCAIPPSIQFNTYPGAISQIVTNLVMNSAIHAFPEQTGTINLEADSDGEKIYFLYSDDGIGMDQLTVKKIFDPFYTTKRNAGGSGLGMHIVYNLVTHQLKGAIKCISSPGKGTQFVISFNGQTMKAAE